MQCCVKWKLFQHIYHVNKYVVWLTFWPNRTKSMSWQEKTQAISMIPTIKFTEQTLWNIYSLEVKIGTKRNEPMMHGKSWTSSRRTAWLTSQSSIPIEHTCKCNIWKVYFRCFAQFCLRQFFKWQSKTEKESGSVCVCARERKCQNCVFV